jgi:hypothetical protein
LLEKINRSVIGKKEEKEGKSRIFQKKLGEFLLPLKEVQQFFLQ